jgi:hypothetical protein
MHAMELQVPSAQTRILQAMRGFPIFGMTATVMNIVSLRDQTNAGASAAKAMNGMATAACQHARASQTALKMITAIMMPSVMISLLLMIAMSLALMAQHAIRIPAAAMIIMATITARGWCISPRAEMIILQYQMT